jgi:AcrR family transcriptional regulator
VPAAVRPPLTRRRAETRQRLLDAALVVFAHEGFGRSTVEQVCEQAGFTRGAFYSNFSSLDELFLAMWEQRSAQLLADLQETVADEAVDGIRTVRQAVEHLLPAVPVDDEWYRITAEFTAHALRNPSLRKVMAAREKAITDTITPVLERSLKGTGRRVTNRSALGQALIAVHDGTTVQCLIEPDDETVQKRRLDLMVHVVLAYTKEIDR